MFLSKERNITNILLLDDLDMWDEFTIKTSDDNHTNNYYKKIKDHIDKQIEASIDWLDSEDARQLFYDEAEYQYELFQSLEDEWDEILEQKYPSVEALLDEVYRRGKEKGYADMEEHIIYTEADRLALLFATEYNFGLIRRLDDDIRYKIKNTLISSFLAGENPNKIIPKLLAIPDNKLEGSIFSPKQRATMIAKTEISRIQNTGMLQSFLNEGYVEVKILTAEDDDVCTTCLEYAYEFKKDDEIIFANKVSEKVHNIISLIDSGRFPPFHPLCRCTYLSVWKTKEQQKDDPPFICLIGETNNQDFKITSRNSALEYYKYKKDPNVKVSFVTDEIDFENPNLMNDENFFKYEFENITIYKSIHGTSIPVEKIYDQYMDLPKKFRESANEIILSSQDFKNENHETVKGFVKESNFNRIHIMSYEYKSLSDKEAIETLVHELAHCFDGPDFKYSNSEDYEETFWDDYYVIENKKIGDKLLFAESQRYVSSDSFRFTKPAMQGNKYSDRVYSEDFADTLMYYFLCPENLELYGARQKYLNNLFN